MKVQKLIEEIENSYCKKWISDFYRMRVTKYLLEGVFALVDGSKEDGLETNEKLLVKLRTVEVKQFATTKRVSYIIETDPKNIRRYWGSNSFFIRAWGPGGGYTTVFRAESHEERFLFMKHANKIVWIKAYKRV